MAATVSMEEYLRTSYRPDVEYIDGELKEKTTGEFTHGEAEGVLGSWFLERRKEWHISCALNTAHKRVRGVCAWSMLSLSVQAIASGNS